MKYEDMMNDKAFVCQKISEILSVRDVDIGVVLSSLESVNYDAEGVKNKKYNLENLYHKNHITDGRVGSWVKYLEEGFVRILEEQYESWFLENGYEFKYKNR
jgi:hypothetical protein